MSELRSLFRGIAVLIDDEVKVEGTEIDRLAKQIENDNCHVIKIPLLPTDDQLSTLAEAAFFILDWNLHNIQAEAGIAGDAPIVRIPQALTRAHTKANIEFLNKLRERRFAPVFIFTNEDTEVVKQALAKEGLFSDGPSDHIFVQSKTAVLAHGVFKILEDWIRGHPSAYALKRWEAAYANARNSFFVDFYLLSHLWPVVLWKTYGDDELSEAAELTSLIGRNILSRLAPVPFDASILAAVNHVDATADEVKPEEVRKVLEGERFIKKDRLQNEVSVGDVFKDSGKFFVNLRPECDCVARDGESVEDIKLYLIRGDKIADSKFHDTFDAAFGNFRDKDTTGTVFAMHDGITVCFRFNDFRIEKWGDWKSKRIGRLIPPYSTKLQQRFASYIQRIGLARIPAQAVPPQNVADAVCAITVQQSHSELTAMGHLKAFFSKLLSKQRR